MCPCLFVGLLSCEWEDFHLSLPLIYIYILSFPFLSLQIHSICLRSSRSKYLNKMFVVFTLQSRHLCPVSLPFLPQFSFFFSLLSACFGFYGVILPLICDFWWSSVLQCSDLNKSICAVSFFCISLWYQAVPRTCTDKSFSSLGSNTLILSKNNNNKT